MGQIAPMTQGLTRCCDTVVGHLRFNILPSPNTLARPSLNVELPLPCVWSLEHEYMTGSGSSGRSQTLARRAAHPFLIDASSIAAQRTPSEHSIQAALAETAWRTAFPHPLLQASNSARRDRKTSRRFAGTESRSEIGRYAR